MDPGDLDPDSDPDPQHCSYVHIEFFRPYIFFLNLYFPKYSNENNTIFDNYEQTTLLENDHFHQYFFTDCKDDILINRYTFMVRFHV